MAEIDKIEAERNDHLTQLARRAGEVTVLESSVATERADRAGLAAEIDSIKSERTRLAGELTQRATEIAALNEKLALGNARQAEMQQRLAAKEAALTKAQVEAAALHQHYEAAVMNEGDNYRKSMTATESEKAELALRLAALEDDYAALRAENTELRRVAGAEWESDREENRRLRERLNEIAAGVVRLAQTTGEDTAVEGNGRRRAESPAAPRQSGPASPTEPTETTLAERLRALQPTGVRH